MSHWAILGIAPTRDRVAIRRAYVRRVKILRPEEDAEGFHALRAAREAALHTVDSWEAERSGRDDPKQDDTLENGAPTDDREWRDGKSLPDETDEDLPRLKIVETELLEDERDPRFLPDKGRALEARLDHLKARLEACIASRDQRGEDIDQSLFDEILRRIVDLPLGSQRGLESECLRLLADGFNDADGTFDPDRALRMRPLVLAADLAFDWREHDDLVHNVLAPRAAQTIALMLETSDPERASKKPLAAWLKRFDAEILLESSPRLLRVHKSALSGRPMPVYFWWWAALLPHFWALRRRYWLVGAGWYVAGALSASIAWAGPRSSRWAVDLSVALTILISLAAGFLADRIVFFYAWKGARKADRRGLFDPVLRRDYLRKRTGTLNAGIFAYLAMMTAYISMLPYFGLFRFLRFLR